MRRKVIQDFANVFCQRFIDLPSGHDLATFAYLGSGSASLNILSGECAFTQQFPELQLTTPQLPPFYIFGGTACQADALQHDASEFGAAASVAAISLLRWSSVRAEGWCEDGLPQRLDAPRCLCQPLLDSVRPCQ